MQVSNEVLEKLNSDSLSVLPITPYLIAYMERTAKSREVAVDYGTTKMLYGSKRSRFSSYLRRFLEHRERELEIMAEYMEDNMEVLMESFESARIRVGVISDLLISGEVSQEEKYELADELTKLMEFAETTALRMEAMTDGS